MGNSRKKKAPVTDHRGLRKETDGQKPDQREQRSDGVGLEGVAAGLALEVVQHLLINDFADLGAGQTAGRGADQGTHQGTADATQRSTDRAGDHTDGKADAGTGERTRSTGGAAGHGTDDTAGHSADVTGQDMGRLAARTLKTHGNTPWGTERRKDGAMKEPFKDHHRVGPRRTQTQAPASP